MGNRLMWAIKAGPNVVTLGGIHCIYIYRVTRVRGSDVHDTHHLSRESNRRELSEHLRSRGVGCWRYFIVRPNRGENIAFLPPPP